MDVTAQSWARVRMGIVVHGTYIPLLQPVPARAAVELFGWEMHTTRLLRRRPCRGVTQANQVMLCEGGCHSLIPGAKLGTHLLPLGLE